VSAFIDQSLRLLKKNGYLAFVTDFSIMHLPKFEKFRVNIFLTNSYIQKLLMIGYGSLPNAGNRPILFISRNYQKDLEKKVGLYRNISYDLNKSFSDDFYIDQIIEDIMKFNNWDYQGKSPKNWNLISQTEFLNLPRAVIDLNIAEKFKSLIEFFSKYPPLDIHHLSKKNMIRKSNLFRQKSGHRNI